TLSSALPLPLHLPPFTPQPAQRLVDPAAQRPSWDGESSAPSKSPALVLACRTCTALTKRPSRTVQRCSTSSGLRLIAASPSLTVLRLTALMRTNVSSAKQ